MYKRQEESVYGCCMQIQFYDTYGDGWNGATLTAVIDGDPSTERVYTVPSGQYSHYVELCVGDGSTLDFSYAPGSRSGSIAKVQCAAITHTKLYIV